MQLSDGLIDCNFEDGAGASGRRDHPTPAGEPGAGEQTEGDPS